MGKEGVDVGCAPVELRPCSSMPLLPCPTQEQVKLFGRNGCTARVVALHVLDPDTGAELGVIRSKVGWPSGGRVCGRVCV